MCVAGYIVGERGRERERVGRNWCKPHSKSSEQNSTKTSLTSNETIIATPLSRTGCAVRELLISATFGPAHTHTHTHTHTSQAVLLLDSLIGRVTLTETGSPSLPSTSDNTMNS